MTINRRHAFLCILFWSIFFTLADDNKAYTNKDTVCLNEPFVVIYPVDVLYYGNPPYLNAPFKYFKTVRQSVELSKRFCDDKNNFIVIDNYYFLLTANDTGTWVLARDLESVGLSSTGYYPRKTVYIKNEQIGKGDSIEIVNNFDSFSFRFPDRRKCKNIRTARISVLTKSEWKSFKNKLINEKTIKKEKIILNTHVSKKRINAGDTIKVLYTTNTEHLIEIPELDTFNLLIKPDINLIFKTGDLNYPFTLHYVEYLFLDTTNIFKRIILKTEDLSSPIDWPSGCKSPFDIYLKDKKTIAKLDDLRGKSMKDEESIGIEIHRGESELFDVFQIVTVYLQCYKKGRFQLPIAQISDNGKLIRSKAIAIRVK